MPPKKNTPKKEKARKNKSPAKTAREKTLSRNATTSEAAPSAEIEDKAAERRVTQMRDKLKKSMADPEMRDQIVRAIRTMLNEGR